MKGPITTPVGKGIRSANVVLRKKLDLYANLRPAKTYQGLRSRYANIDMIIVRENTEDLYAGVEFQNGTPEQQEIIDTITRRRHVLITILLSVSNIFRSWQLVVL